MSWLEISLTVDGELAEAVTDVLNRHIQQGVATELEIDPESDQATSGQVIVRAFLPIDGSENEMKERIERDLWHLRQILDFPEPSYQLIRDQDWTEQWRQNYRPIPVGGRLLIVPAWYEPVENDRLPLFLEPGMAFGTGTHPTTRLCIEALEGHVHTGDRVLDIGCGSGILSIASALLGAETVIAVDVDPNAAQATIENAERNEVASKIHVLTGSLEQILAADSEISLPGDIVVANILTKVLVTLLQQGLTRLMAPGAKLIMSGILAEQLTEIISVASDHSLVLHGVRGEKDWRALVFEKEELPR